MRTSAPGRPLLLAHVARWLPFELSELRLGIISAAFSDLGVLEIPPGSNRGPEIDDYNRAGGSPVGSYWCANAAAHWCRSAGAVTPGPGRDGSCDEWVRMAKRLGTWREKSAYTPEPGDLILYGAPGDANHMGLIVRSEPYLLSIEGNRSWGGFSRNGECVDLNRAEISRALGFVVPTPVR
jgi:hypothetical protein